MPGTIIIRMARLEDASALADLAALDAAVVPAGDVLVAQVGEELWAALPLDGGRPFADPFRPSGELLGLLAARAAQLRPAAPRGRWLRRVGTPRVREVPPPRVV